MTVSTGLLTEIREEMATLASFGYGDPEGNHGKADELLIQTIKWLMAGEPRTITDVVDKIVEDYGRVRKWYA